MHPSSRPHVVTTTGLQTIREILVSTPADHVDGALHRRPATMLERRRLPGALIDVRGRMVPPADPRTTPGVQPTPTPTLPTTDTRIVEIEPDAEPTPAGFLPDRICEIRQIVAQPASALAST